MGSINYLEPSANSKMGNEHEYTILVVEDTPEFRGLMRLLLEGKGYRVLEAATNKQRTATVDFRRLEPRQVAVRTIPMLCRDM